MTASSTSKNFRHKTRFRTPVENDLRAILLDQGVDGERRNGPVRVLLLSLVDPLCRAGKNFKIDHRIILKGIFRRVPPADDRAIRIVKAPLGRQADSNLRIGIERAAGSTAQAGANGYGDVGRHGVMHVPPTGGGESDATQILLLDVRDEFPGEIILDGNQSQSLCSSHAPKSIGSPARIEPAAR